MADRRRSLLHPQDLAARGLIPPEAMVDIARVAARYRLALTPAVADLIDPADPADPIARQFIPHPEELQPAADENPDPIGDATHSPVKGIVHRYPDRVLLTPILHCPVYCRYCFRRETVGGDQAVLSAGELTLALDYIRRRDDIWEVVITGGDPLMLAPAALGAIVAALDAMAQVRVIRLHSRVPISDPGRVTDDLLARLDLATPVWLAVHCNHPRELAPAAAAACRRLAKAGIPLLGQTVLLRGVNDDPLILEQLMRAMVANRIKPYYLHHLDPAPGTARFRTGLAEGQAAMRHLRGRASGLCQPTYVLDIPGGHGKVPVGPCYLHDGRVTDWQGQQHDYPDVAPGRSSC